jgi:thymidylate kinase
MREGYLKMAKEQPSRIRVVDAGGAVAETHSRVMALVLPLIRTED